ncbi:MAG: hypothetical protein IJV34_05970 [Prevotella sp.]|nr:hypothetical protein [Prevotella sp.]
MLKERIFHRLLLLASFVMLSSAGIYAQGVSVEATISPIEILVGEQTQVTLTATMKEGAVAVFPVFQPTQPLMAGIEVLDSKELGVHAKDNGFVERSVVYTLTSFDDSLYYLPPFVVNVDGQPYKSQSLALKVLTVEVDTLHPEHYFGPKSVQENPFLWSEWSPSFWMSVLLLVLMAVGYYLYLRFRDNKPIIATIRIIKRLLPHQKAMKEIEELRVERKGMGDDSQESQKEYYTKLTDTLRRYIEERYGFSAMEMTSAEIIDRLMKSPDSKSLDELRQLFQTADLVKFAKYSTLINENDANLMSAIEFINETKQENMPTEETVKPQLTEEQQRSKKTRTALKWTIIGIGIASVLLFVCIVYSLYLLVA